MTILNTARHPKPGGVGSLVRLEVGTVALGGADRQQCRAVILEKQMGQIANDIISGTCCEICGSFFFDSRNELFSHGYPAVCNDCWKKLKWNEKKKHQRQVNFVNTEGG